MTALAESWLLLIVLVAGLGLGATLVLAVTLLLRDDWAAPLRPSLVALARFGPLVAVALLPALIWFAPMLYPPGEYAPVRLLRTAATLAVITGLGWWVTRPTASRWSGGVALMVLTLVGALALEDWALSRDPSWTGSVQGVALLVGLAAASLSLATLRAVGLRVLGDGAPATGLERMLLTLALTVLWLWFTQFVVVYAADMPAEAAWYLRRQAWPWGALKHALGVPALLAAVALALVPQWRAWRFAAVAVLLLIQQAVHLLWLLRPQIGSGALAWTDAAALLPLFVLAVQPFARPRVTRTIRSRRRVAGAG